MMESWRWGNWKNLWWRLLKNLELQMTKPNWVICLSTRFAAYPMFIHSLLFIICKLVVSIGHQTHPFTLFLTILILWSQINSSSKFRVENKYVHLAAKDWSTVCLNCSVTGGFQLVSSPLKPFQAVVYPLVWIQIRMQSYKSRTRRSLGYIYISHVISSV